MSFKLHFLGTGGMVPTKERNQIGIALEHEGNVFIFDCGENSQKQIKLMKIPIGKIKKIFISHWHGDHTLGLNGLVQTLSNTNNIEKIEIHGPKNSKKFVDNMLKSTIFDSKVPIEIFEYNPEENEELIIQENIDIKISCVKLNHNDVPCIGYIYKVKDKLNVDLEKLRKIAPELEKSSQLARVKMGIPLEYEGKLIKPEEVCYSRIGAKVGLIFDTRPCQGTKIIANNATYLICESTHYHQKHHHKAIETYHITSKEAAKIALEGNVKKLFLTHFSQRYKDITPLIEEAKEIFENTEETYDLQTIKLKQF